MLFRVPQTQEALSYIDPGVKFQLKENIMPLDRSEFRIFEGEDAY